MVKVTVSCSFVAAVSLGPTISWEQHMKEETYSFPFAAYNIPRFEKKVPFTAGMRVFQPLVQWGFEFTTFCTIAQHL